MEDSRREYRFRRLRDGAGRHALPGPGRHRVHVSSAVRARRVIASVALVLAGGSAAIGAARGAEVTALATGSVELPPAASSSVPTAGPTWAPQPSQPAATASPATPSPTPSKPAATPTSAPTTKPAARPPARVRDRGNGRLLPVRVPGADSTGAGRVVTYAFEVEDGLGIDRAAAAKVVGQTLRDPRGWQLQDGVRFVQVTPAQRSAGTQPALTISLVSPKKVDQMCAPLSTLGQWSCANKDHAVLNYRRWALATPSYAAVRASYRPYLINHEVGHELGHPHATCGSKGQPARVMVQQSKGLGGCTPNAWPTATRG